MIIHQDILKSKAANIQNGISNAKFNNFLIASLGDVDTEISVDYKLPLDLDPSTFFVELLESTLKKH